MNWNTLSLSILLAGLAFACSPKQVREDRSSNIQTRISPFSGSFDLPYLTIEVEASQGKNITLDNGTTIEVPANAFEDQDGKPYSGSLTLKYREFQNAADIMVAGIPMDFSADNYGENQDFVTAGSFEVLAEDQDGKPLALAKGKQLTVALSTNVDKGDYQSYFYDQERQEWEFIGTHKTTLNPNKTRWQTTVDSLSMNQKNFVLNMASFFDVKSDTFSAYLVEKHQKSLRKVMDQYHLDFAIADCQDEVRFGKYTYPAAEMVWQWIEGSPFNRFSQYGEGDYRVVCTPGINGHYVLEVKKWKYNKNWRVVYEPQVYASLLAKPVMPVRMLLSAKPADWDANYEATLARTQVAEQALEKQCRALRTMRVEKLGIYNCDRFYQDETAQEMFLALNFEGKLTKEDLNTRNTKKYVLVEGERGLIPIADLDQSLTVKKKLLANKDIKVFVACEKGVFLSEVERLEEGGEYTIDMKDMGPADQIGDIYAYLQLPQRTLALADSRNLSGK